MPTRSIACACGGTRVAGTCNRCGRGKRAPDQRPSFHRRGYTSAWIATRLRFLKQNPVCVDCMKSRMVTAAIEVHHIIKVADDPTKMHDTANLMALCKSCHSKRTARGE